MMNFYHLATKNLLRSQTRTILTIVAVVVATIVLFAIFSLDRGYRLAVEEELVKKSGVHLYITREGCPMEVASIIAQGGVSPLFVSAELKEKVQGIKSAKYIKEVMPFSINAITTPDGSRTDIFLGVTEAIQHIRPNWRLNRGSWFKDTSSIILGNTLARIENREIGDKIYFEHFNREFEVVGILEPTYTQDDGTFFLPLDVLLRLFQREGKLSAIGLQLTDIARLEEVMRDLREILPGEYFIIPSDVLTKGVLSFFGSTKAIMLVMVMIALAMCIFAIMNTFLMAVFERRKEFGYMKCVGAGGSDITYLVFSETLIVTGIGIIFGLSIGSLLLPAFENYMRQFLFGFIPVAKIVRPSLGIGLLTSALVIAASGLSSFYPAMKAARAIPMEAIRNE